MVGEEVLYFSFSRACFARKLADVFEKNEKKNKTTSVFRLDHPSLLHSRFCVVTQRCSPRDYPKNGCVADTDVIFAVRLALRKTAYEGDGGVFPEIWTMWHAIRGPKHVISSTLFSDLTQTREQTTAYRASSQFPLTRGGGLDWLQHLLSNR